MRLRVDVQRVSGHPDVPDDRSLSLWAGAAATAGAARAPFAERAGEAEISLRVVDDAESASLNDAYRGKAGATNVLSFPFDAPMHTDPPLLGDVVVCAPVVVREAAGQGKSVEAHFAHMVVHGVLHLCGFEHDNETQADEMEGLERQVLAGLGYADPYRVREEQVT